jgi:hypothetical protein
LSYVLASLFCCLGYFLQHYFIAPIEQEFFPTSTGVYISLICLPFGIKTIAVVVMGAKVWPFLMLGQYVFASAIQENQEMAILVSLSGTLALGIVAVVLNYICHRKWWQTVDVKSEECTHNMWRASLLIAFLGSALTVVFHTIFSLPEAASALSIRSMIGGVSGTIAVIILMFILRRFFFPTLRINF